MITFINYLVETTLGLLLLLVFYKVFLAKETNFKFLRYFLLAGISLSIVLPLFHFQGNQVSETLAIGEVLSPYQLPEVIFTDNSSPLTTRIGITLQALLISIYFLGASILLCIFIYRIFKLIRAIRTEASIPCENFSIIESRDYSGSFSFFNFIFIGQADAITDAEKRQIIEHEKVHVQEFHSLDILLLNTLSIVFWFNPFIRTYKKVFVQLHEFEADARAVKSHDANMYCSLLARVALQSAGFSLANHFNNSLTIKRIIMIRTIKKKISQWKLAMVGILFPCMFFMLACQDQVMAQQEKSKPAQVSESNEVFVAVEELPTYIGGPKKMNEFISENMRYPKASRKKGIEGTVFVSLVVEKDGTIGDVNLVKGIDAECDAEAVRVAKLLNTWQPGKQSGKAVRVQLILPVKFKLG